MRFIILQHIYFESETEDARPARGTASNSLLRSAVLPVQCSLDNEQMGVEWSAHVCIRVCVCALVFQGLTMRNAFVMPARRSRHKSPFFLIEAHRVMW